MEKEEAEEVKKQILKQLEGSDVKNRDQIIEAIKVMSPEELETFLKENQIAYKTSNVKDQQECVFCSIVAGKTPSYKLEENKKALAILEINPLSLGHSIVLSRDHNKLAASAFTLANKIAKRIKSKLKPEDIKIESAKILGHELINIIPIYKDIKLEKKRADEKELTILQDKLKSKTRKKKVKPVKITEQKLEQAPRRVP